MADNNGQANSEYLETTDEDGVVHYFEKVQEIEIDEDTYALLVYQGSDNDEDEEGDSSKAEDDSEDGGFEEEYVIMKLVHDGDGVVFESIDDEEEFKRVIEYLESQDFDIELMEEEEPHVHGPGCSHHHDSEEHEVSPETFQKILEQLPHTESDN